MKPTLGSGQLAGRFRPPVLTGPESNNKSFQRTLKKAGDFIKTDGGWGGEYGVMGLCGLWSYGAGL